MYTRRAALLNNSLYAAGYLKSTGAPDKEGFVEADQDFCLTGPYNNKDPTGFYFSNVVCSNLVSYTTEHGSFAQYEVGVTKIDATTGEPQDIYVYYGEGQDETSGLAVKALDNGDSLMALSGHFVGSLTADHGNGNTTSTIYNSNAEGGADFVQHPNAIKNGFDDGFVISADAETGHTNWLVAYPISNKDAQTVGVDIDGEGNIYGAGYSCNFQVGDDKSEANDETPSVVICDGFVAKFAAEDGKVLWEQEYPDLGAAMWIAYDKDDDSLYVTGTTSYIGQVTDVPTDVKNHAHCNHDICAVTMRLSASDGTTEWVRATEGSPRWNFFDQTGDIELANELDGPYIYVALDDVGEFGLATLDEGTPYAACRDDNDGTLTPEFKINPNGVVTAGDCPDGSTFVPRSDEENAYPAASASTGTNCGAGHEGVAACIMKYHKYTGLPIWGADVHPVAGIAPAPDGKSIMVAGFYWNSEQNGHGNNFDSVALPNYNGIEGSYNAKLSSETGQGEYVMHSGGVGKTRVYDIVGDPDGDVYMVGYTQSAVINWGGSLQTKIIEEGIDQNDDAGTAFQMGKVSSSTSEYQFFAVKLTASETGPHSCVETCDLKGGNVANPVIKDENCLIDNVCYEAGETAEIFGRPCLMCNPKESKTKWSFGEMVGDYVCFIDDVCQDKGDFYSYRASRRETFVSQCQICDPSSNSASWSVLPDFVLVPDTEPPNDCLNATDIPTSPPTTAAVASITEPHIPSPITMAPTEPPISKPVVISNTVNGDGISVATDEVITAESSGAATSIVDLGSGKILLGIAIGCVANIMMVLV